MTKRKAADLGDVAETRQFKQTCIDNSQWHRCSAGWPMDMAVTPPPDDMDDDQIATAYAEDDALMAHLEASQTALIKYLDQKTKNFHDIAPQKTLNVQSKIGQITMAIRALNQEINAVRAETSSLGHDYLSGRIHMCQPGNPYFAPHQYVPVPQG